MRVKMGNEVYNLSTDARDFFQSDPVKQMRCVSAMEMMRDCLDTIYQTVHPFYPKTYKPGLYLSDSLDVNAFAWKGKIVIHAGLLFAGAKLIEKRYTQQTIDKYALFEGLERPKILSGLRVYLWRFVVLHELYHIWNGHSEWKRRYRFNETGELETRTGDLNALAGGADDASEIIFSEKASATLNGLSAASAQDYLTQQAMEFHADSCAVCMMIHLLMQDVDRGANRDMERNTYIAQHMGLMIGALVTAFCLFDRNHGADFSALSALGRSGHPLPALRFVYAEEIANGCLSNYFADPKTVWDLQSEWRKIAWDAEAEYDGQTNMGQVFYYPAFTKAAQDRIYQIKRRMIEFYDSMLPFILGNHAEKLSLEDIEVLPESIWFDEEGNSLRGWINPATGEPRACRSK